MPVKSVILNLEEFSLSHSKPDSLQASIRLFDNEGKPLGHGSYGVYEMADTIRRGISIPEGYSISVSSPLPMNSTAGINAVGVVLSYTGAEEDNLFNRFNYFQKMKLIPDNLRVEINLRMDSLRRHMREEDADALLVASNPNLYYTTCRFFRGYVYIPVEGNPLWFVIKPNVFDSENDVVLIRKPEMIATELVRLGYKSPMAVGYEFDDLSYSDVSRLKAIFPEAKVANGSKILRKSRMVKTEWEIDRMKEDGIHQAEVYRRVTKCYQEDMTDLEFQIEIERVLRREGCLGVSRTSGNLMDINMGSSVIAGENADTPSPYDFTMGGAGIDPSLPEVQTEQL